MVETSQSYLLEVMLMLRNSFASQFPFYTTRPKCRKWSRIANRLIFWEGIATFLATPKTSLYVYKPVLHSKCVARPGKGKDIRLQTIDQVAPRV